MATNLSTSTIANSGKVLQSMPPIRRISRKVLTGCNIYHQSTVLCERFDFGLMADAMSSQVSDHFASEFQQRFLALKSFVTNNGMQTDFIDRLNSPEGVGLAEVLLEAIVAVDNHRACMMHDLDSVTYAALEKVDQQVVYIWSTTAPRFSRLASAVAVLGVRELLPERYRRWSRDDRSFSDALAKMQQSMTRRRLATSTATLKMAAKKKGLPCELVGRQLLCLGQGKFQSRLYASMSSNTSIGSQKICADKRLSNRYLQELRLPVARQIKVGSCDAAQKAALKLGFPVVIKPVKGSRGRGVTVGLQREEDIESAFNRAHHSGNDVLVEKYIPGTDHRLLVIGGVFVAAAIRKPPAVCGDGRRTIEQLVDDLNQHAYRDEFRWYPVKKDQDLQRFLEWKGYTMESVLPAEEQFELRSTANISTGGIPIDVTDEVHPDNQQLAERIAKGLALDIAGIDFVSSDITRSYREVGGAIIEVNVRPGLTGHTWPEQGKPRNVAGVFLDLLYPSGADARLPVVAIAGDKGTGTVARYLDALLRQAGRSVALELRKEAFVNGVSAELNSEQETSAALTLLHDPDIDTLVRTVSLRRTARRGFQLDNCSLSVVMNRMIDGNVEQFHQGMDVIGRATSDCFVVDAGNIVALDKLSKYGKRRFILVSERPDDEYIAQYLAAGHGAVVLRWQGSKPCVVIISGPDVVATLPLPGDSSPKGIARRRRLKNGRMFAIAAAYGLGVSVEKIAEGIAQFPEVN